MSRFTGITCSGQRYNKDTPARLGHGNTRRVGVEWLQKKNPSLKQQVVRVRQSLKLIYGFKLHSADIYVQKKKTPLKRRILGGDLAQLVEK